MTSLPPRIWRAKAVVADRVQIAEHSRPFLASLPGDTAASAGVPLMEIDALEKQEPTPATRILLVDDHTLVRAAIRSLLDTFGGVTVVAEAGNGRQALDFVAKYQPRVVLMDIVMPGLDGIEATSRIVKEYPDVRVLILSMYVSEEHVLRALRAGASGYVYKGSPASEFQLAIKSVGRGDVFLSPSISKHVIEVFLSRKADQVSSLEQLTPRQREVLKLIAEGHSSKQIAEILTSSLKTVDSHRTSIMERLGIHNVSGLVRYAIRQGLVALDR